MSIALPMPLIRLAATIAGEDTPVVVFGLADAPVPDVPVASPILAVPGSGARRLAGLLTRGDEVSPSSLSEVTGLGEDVLAGAVALLIPGRDAGWTTTDAAALAASLASTMAAVVVTGRLAGLARTPAELVERLKAAAAPTLFAGWLPPDDTLAPGCPTAIVQRLPAAVDLPITAILRIRDDAPILEHTLGWLAAEGVATIAVDGGSRDDSAAVAESWLGRGVISVARGGTEDEAAFLEETAALGVSQGWVVRLGAAERVEGPWPDRDLRETLGSFAAAGWDAAGATVLTMGPGPGDDGRSDFARGPRPWRFALPDPGAPPVACRREGDGRKRSPYNLVVRRYPAGHAGSTGGAWPVPSPTSGDWEAWDDAARERYLVERLTGHGIFRRLHPTPSECVWFTEERLVEWSAPILKGGLGQLPYPDPLASAAGTMLIRWDAPDGQPVALYLESNTGSARLVGHGASGTITVDGLEPNKTYVGRLYTDETRSHLLSELRFGIRMGGEG